MKHEVSKSFDNSGTRNEVRKRIIECFMEEQPGEGKGELASTYNYIVKILFNGNRVILTRPANLKNGFDFLIRVEGIDFSHGNERRHRDYPKHKDIIKDLEEKKDDNIEMYKKLYCLIDKLYNCENITDEEIQDIHFTSGFASDMILHVVKWFFIEQDIRYWNYSGRAMFMSAVPEI